MALQRAWHGINLEGSTGTNRGDQARGTGMKMKFRKTDWTYPLVTVLVFAADQGCKAAARKKLKEGERMPLSDFFRKGGTGGDVRVYLYNSRNRGAAMNLLDKHPVFLGGVSLGYTTMLTMLYGWTLAFSDRKTQKAGLALLLGGAWSNTIDRVRRQYVTDYLNFNLGPGPFRDVVYNLGDCAIGIGTALALAGSIKEEGTEPESAGGKQHS